MAGEISNDTELAVITANTLFPVVDGDEALPADQNKHVKKDAIRSLVAISNPHVIYVRSDGNNGTAAIGNPALPYSTGTAAYDAGVAAAVPFSLDFGVGTFSIDLATDWNGLCREVRGCGAGDITTYGTLVQIDATVSNVVDGSGSAAWGFTSTLNASNLVLTIQGTGGSVTNTVGGTLDGGNGSCGTINAHGCTVYISSNGGSDNSSSSGDVNGGIGGGWTLRGGRYETLYNSGGTPYGSGSTGSDGAVDGSFCNFRGSPDIKGLSAGNCAVASGVTIASDKGGNSTW